jgi:acyl carrier protein
VNRDLERIIERRERALDRVRELLVAQLKVRKAPDEIDPDAPLWGTGLGLDSLDAVELQVCLEEELGVALPEEATGRARMRTVNALVELVLATEARRG